MCPALGLLNIDMQLTYTQPKQMTMTATMTVADGEDTKDGDTTRRRTSGSASSC